MEKFDILDEDGNITGITANKGTVLSDGQYYLGVHAYIYNVRNEFLLQQRSFDKEFLPGGWDIHMGHVIAGESSLEAIIREIREETGLSVSSDQARFAGRIRWEMYHHMIDVYFVMTDFNADRLSLQAEEVINVKSVGTDEMLSLVSAMDYRPEEYRRLVAREIIANAPENGHF